MIIANFRQLEADQKREHMKFLARHLAYLSERDAADVMKRSERLRRKRAA